MIGGAKALAMVGECQDGDCKDPAARSRRRAAQPTLGGGGTARAVDPACVAARLRRPGFVSLRLVCLRFDSQTPPLVLAQGRPEQ